MTPYFFSARENDAEKLRILGGDSAKVYPDHQAQDWMRAILEDVDPSDPSNFHLTIDFLADVAVGTVLERGCLMSVDVADRDALDALTAEAQSTIALVYPT